MGLGSFGWGCGWLTVAALVGGCEAGAREAAEPKEAQAVIDPCADEQSAIIADERPIATVNGRTLVGRDLGADAKAAEQRALRHYCLERVRIRRLAVDRAVGRALVAQAGAERSIATEVERRLVVPTDADVDDFVAARVAAGDDPSDWPRGQVHEELTQMARQRAREAVIDALRDRAEVQVFVDVRPPRLEVSEPRWAPTRGPADAPIVVTEFIDFECPFCAEASPLLRQVADGHDDVRVVVRQFPLDAHSGAREAAKYALCAHEQGVFWDFHDGLFGSCTAQSVLSKEGLDGVAAEVGLDPAVLEHCLAREDVAAAVDTDYREALELGLDGTPTFLVNGRPLDGVPSLQELEQTVRLERESDVEDRHR